jgi:hypothetical protein
MLILISETSLMGVTYCVGYDLALDEYAVSKVDGANQENGLAKLDVIAVFDKFFEAYQYMTGEQYDESIEGITLFLQ